MTGVSRQPAWATRLHKTALLLLLLFAVVILQTSAAAEIHPHSHDTNHFHCCPTCHAGHLPAIQPANGPALGPPVAAVWRAGSQRHAATPELFAISSPSRAPPA